MKNPQLRRKALVRMLIVDESIDVLEAIAPQLRSNDYAVLTREVDSEEDLNKALEEHVWDLILHAGEDLALDLERTVSLVRQSGQDVPIICIHRRDESASADAIVKALQIGASDVVDRANSQHLYFVVDRELDRLVKRRAWRVSGLSLKRTEARYRELVRRSRVAVACIRDGGIEIASEAFLRLFGYGARAQLPGDFLEMIAEDDRQALADLIQNFDKHLLEPVHVEIDCRRADGVEFTASVELSNTVLDGRDATQIFIAEPAAGSSPPPAPAPAPAAPPAPARENHPQGAAGAAPASAASAGEVRRQRGPAQAAPGSSPNSPDHAISKDPVSELYTQEYLSAAVDKAITRAVKDKQQSSLLYIELRELDKFLKAVSAVDGRELLRQMGAVIVMNISPHDIAARLEHDTFGVLLASGNLSDARSLADKLGTELPKAARGIKTAQPVPTPSIGIAPISGSQTSYMEVVANAFSACHQAHRAGDKASSVYQPTGETPVHLEGTQHLTREVLDALHAHRFSLNFQPIVRLQGEPLELYEVFLRVHGQFNQEIPTEAIFPIANEHKLITIIDEWVISSSLKILGDLLKAGHQTNFFIKLTKDAIRDEHIALVIQKHLKANQVPGHHLIIELSETYAADDVGLAKYFISALKKLKCRAALEHFGGGINSLKLADSLPVDYLKIDSVLVSNMQGNADAVASLKAIIGVAQSSNKLTIAECVEDVGTLMLLYECGVDFVQGNYIQEPGKTLEFDFTSSFVEETD